MYAADAVRAVEIVELFEQAEEILWGYEAEIDDKTCKDCKDLHGKTFSTDQVESKFEYLAKDTYVWRPNVHPNCRCRLVRLVVIH